MATNEPDRTYTSFLGTGWSFPPEFVQGGNPGSGQVLMTADEADVDASLRILLGTGIGERFLNPGYGTDMHEILFEPLSTTMQTYIKDKLKTAILIYEPRINLLSLELDTSAQRDGRVGVLIEYEIRTTNSRYNLVYPFYLTDGNEARRSVDLNNR